MKRTPYAHILILVAFFLNSFGSIPSAQAQDFVLPKPGVMVHLSPPMDPPMLKGIKVHTDNPFKFDFILDKGDGPETNDQQLKTESEKLIKYFLASLTIPEKDLWVNLSPYEKDRIIPQSFGLTEMGRDLLAEDYMLKQITASLIYPEDEVGKKFWKRIYEEAQAKYHTTNIPVNTFNKVWIVPEKAVVYENAKAGTAYVVESRLKVMLEEDYLSLEKHQDDRDKGSGVRGKQTQPIPYPLTLTPNQDVNKIGSQIVREIVLPELEREVNEGVNFTQLRQVYNSLILATWYKKKIKDSILSKVYSDKNKVQGVNIEDPQEKEKIYQQYLKAFKKGVYNYIKEESDPATQQSIPRKYFSGGADLAMNTAGHFGMGAFSSTSNQKAISNEALNSSNQAQVAVDILDVDQAMDSGIDPIKFVEGLRSFQNDVHPDVQGWDRFVVSDPAHLEKYALVVNQFNAILKKIYTVEDIDLFIVDVLKLHRIIADIHGIQHGGTIYRNAEYFKNLMKGILNGGLIRSNGKDVAKAGGYLFARLVFGADQFFYDGNHRIGLFVTNYLLMKNGLKPIFLNEQNIMRFTLAVQRTNSFAKIQDGISNLIRAQQVKEGSDSSEIKSKAMVSESPKLVQREIILGKSQPLTEMVPELFENGLKIETEKYVYKIMVNHKKVFYFIFKKGETTPISRQPEIIDINTDSDVIENKEKIFSFKVIKENNQPRSLITVRSIDKDFPIKVSFLQYASDFEIPSATSKVLLGPEIPATRFESSDGKITDDGVTWFSENRGLTLQIAAVVAVFFVWVGHMLTLLSQKKDTADNQVPKSPQVVRETTKTLVSPEVSIPLEAKRISMETVMGKMKENLQPGVSSNATDLNTKYLEPKAEKPKGSKVLQGVYKAYDTPPSDKKASLVALIKPNSFVPNYPTTGNLLIYGDAKMAWESIIEKEASRSLGGEPAKRVEVTKGAMPPKTYWVRGYHEGFGDGGSFQKQVQAKASGNVDKTTEFTFKMLIKDPGVYMMLPEGFTLEKVGDENEKQVASLKVNEDNLHFTYTGKDPMIVKLTTAKSLDGIQFTLSSVMTEHEKLESKVFEDHEQYRELRNPENKTTSEIVAALIKFSEKQMGYNLLVDLTLQEKETLAEYYAEALKTQYRVYGKCDAFAAFAYAYLKFKGIPVFIAVGFAKANDDVAHAWVFYKNESGILKILDLTEGKLDMTPRPERSVNVARQNINILNDPNSSDEFRKIAFNNLMILGQFKTLWNLHRQGLLTGIEGLSQIKNIEKYLFLKEVEHALNDSKREYRLSEEALNWIKKETVEGDAQEFHDLIQQLAPFMDRMNSRGLSSPFVALISAGLKDGRANLDLQICLTFLTKSANLDFIKDQQVRARFIQMYKELGSELPKDSHGILFYHLLQNPMPEDKNNYKNEAVKEFNNARYEVLKMIWYDLRDNMGENLYYPEDSALNLARLIYYSSPTKASEYEKYFYHLLPLFKASAFEARLNVSNSSGWSNIEAIYWMKRMEERDKGRKDATKALEEIRTYLKQLPIPKSENNIYLMQPLEKDFKYATGKKFKIKAPLNPYETRMNEISERVKEYQKGISKDRAMNAQDKKGGIDFNTDKWKLQTRNEGGEIKFDIDPTMLQQLQNAPGFTPVIINIQPMTDLKGFLGLTEAGMV